MGFSPLRYWGSLYRLGSRIFYIHKVLVPFDIGVVYIKMQERYSTISGFSPLRYWGSLYPMDPMENLFIQVLVPFVIGVVYIPSLFWVTGYLFIAFSLSIYVFGTFVLIYFFLVKWYRPPYLYYITFFDFSKF